MSKFNTKQVSAQKTVSYEGGEVYNKDIIEDWINNLFSSFLEKRYYSSAEQQQARYIELTEKVGKQLGWEFVAKASIFARNELGLRSIAQLTAAILNDKTFEGKRAYFRNFCLRPDDVSEIYAAIDMLGRKRSHALVRGTADYLSTLNSYTLGKYKLNNKIYNMYDLINISHAHSSVIDDFKSGLLAISDTWEVAIASASTQEKKENEWKRLVEDNKLGYIALIRNLRNILSCKWISHQWIDDYLIPQLVNAESIKRSLVYPYQIYCAFKAIKKEISSQIKDALEDAFILSCLSLPELSGTTAIILDISGSMEDTISFNSNITLKEIGAVYAAIIYISNPGSTFIKFGSDAAIKAYSPIISFFDIIEDMQKEEGLGHGTYIDKAFNCLNRNYNRIFIISDMQTMAKNNRHFYYKDLKVNKTYFEEYCKTYGHSKCYSFDLGNYTTQLDNPNNKDIFFMTTLNEKVFDFIRLAENNINIADYIQDNYEYI